jgi:thioredoxin 1
MRPCKLILTVHFATTALLAFAIFSAIAAPAHREDSRDTLTVTSANLDELLASHQLILLDFSADWCAPCQMLAPHVDRMARKYPGRVLAGRINIDRERSLGCRFGVQGIPHLKLVRDGKVIDSILGYVSEEEIDRKLQQHLRES